VLLAATTRPEIRASALLRAGRFDHQMLAYRRDKAGRLAILRVHQQQATLGPEDGVNVAAIKIGRSGPWPKRL